MFFGPWMAQPVFRPEWFVFDGPGARSEILEAEKTKRWRSREREEGVARKEEEERPAGRRKEDGERRLRIEEDEEEGARRTRKEYKEGGGRMEDSSRAAGVA